MSTQHRVELLLLLVGAPGAAAAQLRLAPVIRDDMVLQRHAPVPVWGWTDRDDTVVVTFDHQTYTARPDSSGQWRIKLPPRAAGGPYEMTVTGQQQRFQVRNILIGDVWLCAGQSNMAWPVMYSRNAAQEIAAAHDQQIRHFTAQGMAGRWAVADSAHVSGFTAVGYFFARELRKSVDVPIGLINLSEGGSRIEEWMSREALRLDSGIAGERSASPGSTALYNKRVHPLLPYPIKGILWYQGESNAAPADALKYRELFTSLIQDWRRAWGRGDLPFLFVQLPNYGSVDTVPAPSSSRAVLREAQSAALRLPHTAQVVTIDLGAEARGRPADEHPSNKQDVGARLALAARKLVYGERVEASGPLYRRHTVQKGRVVLEFAHVGRGLIAGREEGELQGFAIAGADRQFVWANAKIEGDRVVVWSEHMPQPAAVRYAWGNNPDRANLYNRAGLPAAPFRTDEWPHKP